MTIGHTYHVHATKDWVKKQIRIHGVKDVLGLEHTTEGDAFAMLDADPREYFVLADCDNQKKDGTCGGHSPTQGALCCQCSHPHDCCRCSEEDGDD